MIFPKLRMAKQLPLISFLNYCLLLLLLMPGLLPAATIEIGVDSTVTSYTVERLNASDSDSVVSPSEQTVPPEVPVTTVAPLSEPTDELSRRHPHIFTRPQVVENLSSRPNATVERVLQPQGVPQTQTLSGKGSKELVALDDGEVSLAVYLYTYERADIVVRLYDEEGNEILFNGQPLLTWRRVDDSSFAPVKFKGEPDMTSMYEQSPGNYSPTSGIDYKFTIGKGQKLVLTTGGDAEPRSFVKATSSVF